MRPALLLSVALAALPATGLAAQSPPTLRIVTENPLAPGGDGTSEHFFTITIREGMTAYKLDRVFVKSWSTSGDAGAPPPRGRGVNELAANDTAGKEKSPARKDMALKGSNVRDNSVAGDPDRPLVAGRVPNRSTRPGTVDKNETITIHGNRTESGRPQQKGSVWVRVSSPWTACRVGARYPSLELGGGGKTYVLNGVAVASCGTAALPDEVAFSYRSISFQY